MDSKKRVPIMRNGANAHSAAAHKEPEVYVHFCFDVLNGIALTDIGV